MVDILSHGRNGAKDEIKLMRLREQVLVNALEFYANAEWNDDYPGGITVRVKDKMWLDTGDSARAALEAVKE
jgi:hypothetical protein